MVTMPAAASPGARRSVVAELEGGLLRGADTFPYFMLVAFEASGLPRFAALLALWPLLRLLELAGRGGLALRAAALVATAGVPRAEVEAVSRAVLPKFMADDVDPRAWAAFGACEGRRVVVATRLPRVMVERFAREHLGAHEVVGCDLEYSRLRRCTGLLRGGGGEAVAGRVRALFAGGDRPDLGIGRSEMARSFLPLCKVRHRSSSKVSHGNSSFIVNQFPCFFPPLGKTCASTARKFKRSAAVAADFAPPRHHPCAEKEYLLPVRHGQM